jgi:transposase-like protein
MAVSFKGAHFPPDIILTGVRWYVAYPLSTRHVEELMEERGIRVDHSTINRSTPWPPNPSAVRDYCPFTTS